MNIVGLLIVVALVLLLFGGLGANYGWGGGPHFGYGGMGIGGLVLIVVLILFLTGRL